MNIPFLKAYGVTLIESFFLINKNPYRPSAQCSGNIFEYYKKKNRLGYLTKAEQCKIK